MILYQFDHEGLTILENKNNEDFEFHIKVKNEKTYLTAMHEVRSFFENNNIYTDVIFYTRSDHTYQIIVRKDFYVDFLLVLFKHRLLKEVTWNN